MLAAAEALDFERAAELRDQIDEIKARNPGLGKGQGEEESGSE